MGTLGQILQFIGILFLVLMVFNVLIIVHEWGHFLAGRWRGLKIDRFQIWFGKPLWKKTYNGVQYGLGCIPAGGFVSLPQMAPMEAIEGKTAEGEEEKPAEELPPISALDKIIVAFAGPLFSFGLAIVFAIIVWIVGKPETQLAQSDSIGYVFATSAAEEAGFKPGDKILTVDGKEIKRFHGMIDSVDWNVITSEKSQIPFEIERPGEGKMTLVLEKDLEDDGAEAAEEAKSVPWYKKAFQFAFRRSALFDAGMRGTETPMVAEVSEHGPADLAGLQQGDFILALDGNEMLSRFQVSEHLKGVGSNPVTVTYGRDGQEVEVVMTPRLPEVRPDYLKNPIVGIAWDDYGISQLVHPRPIEQVTDSMRVIVSTLQAVFSSETGVSAEHLSGPVGIVRLYYRLFQHPDGWRLVLWFSVVLNINLAVLNMLPFPVLDGGHIMLATVEAVRRKPINFRALEVIQTACVLLLFGFMIFVTLKDTGDLMGGKGGEIRFLAPGEELEVAPESAAPPKES